MRSICIALCACIIGQGPTLALAQTFPTSDTLSPVATINQDRLFSDSAYGKSFNAKFQKDANDLAEENRRIEQDLIDEEMQLTQTRKELPNAEFRKLADAFNEKVERIRTEQATKTNELNATRIQARRAFVRLAQPIIIELMQERGIQFILNDQAIFMATSDGDITEAAIALIDARLSAAQPSQDQ